MGTEARRRELLERLLRGPSVEAVGAVPLVTAERGLALEALFGRDDLPV